jgi:hypothetical protein
MKKRTILLLAVLYMVVYQVRYAHPFQHGSWTDDPYADAQSGQIDLGIPDLVQSGITALHTSIADTGMSMVVPQGYGPAMTFCGLIREDGTNISVERNYRSYYSHISHMTDCLTGPPDGASDHKRLLYRKSFKHNGYDAMLVCVADSIHPYRVVYMTMGNDKVCITMKGKCQNNDDEALREIVSTFLTSYYSEPRA